MRQDSSTPPIRTALYVRVSSEAQDTEDKVSLGEQVRDIEAYAAERGYSITHRYTDVESGASRTRPGFREMQGSAKAGAFDVVLAWRTDRLARSGSAMGDLLDSTKKHGIGIETVKEPFDRRYAGLMAEVAAIEREAFAERSLMGKVGVARQGRIPAGKPVYGYRRAEDGRPVVDDLEAAVVNRLFDMYAHERLGVPTIMKVLEAECGFRRTAANAYLMLRNPAYIGEHRFRDVLIPSRPIVDRATWDRAQGLLTKKTVTASRGNTKVDYLLQGIIACEGCGRILSARTRREKSGRTLRYYRCRGYIRSCRPRPYIRADELEKQAWYHVRAVLARPDLVVKRFSDNDGALDEDIKAAARDLQKWNRRNERLTAIFVQGIIDQDEYEHQRRFVREPLEAAEERLRRLRVQKERADAAVDVMAAFRASAAEYLESLGVDPKTGEPSSDGGPLDVEGRKQVIRDVVESATIDADNQLRYQLRVPDLTKVAITSSTPAWT